MRVTKIIFSIWLPSLQKTKTFQLGDSHHIKANRVHPLLSSRVSSPRVASEPTASFSCPDSTGSSHGDSASEGLGEALHLDVLHAYQVIPMHIPVMMLTGRHHFFPSLLVSINQPPGPLYRCGMPGPAWLTPGSSKHLTGLLSIQPPHSCAFHPSEGKNDLPRTPANLFETFKPLQNPFEYVVMLFTSTLLSYFYFWPQVLCRDWANTLTVPWRNFPLGRPLFDWV